MSSVATLLAATSVLLLLVLQPAWSRISCKDDKGVDVDWFIIYKLPVKFDGGSYKKPWPFPPHLYMDANKDTFVKKSFNLNETSAVSLTLSQSYNSQGSLEVGYIFYNDQKPEAAGGAWTEAYGHTKGVTTFDQNSGFWLVHSVPKFPPPTNSSYMFPDNAVYYGQHLFCISLASTADIEQVGQLLRQNEPFIYDWNLPKPLVVSYPAMAEVIREIKPTNTTLMTSINTHMGRKLTAFGKSHSYGEDLYAGFVGPSLQCSMDVETWQHGSELPSNCSTNLQVENVRRISSKVYGMNFSNYYDHSKFAVCSNPAANGATTGLGDWICIGGINRQSHQLTRGGGVVCMNDGTISKQYRQLISEVEECSHDDTGI